MRRQLAVPGVEFLIAKIWQMRRGDLQHVRAVFRQRASAGRPGQHARQIQHAHARQRTLARGQLLWRCVADPYDLQQRQGGDGGRLRMLCPFGVRAHHAAGTFGGDDRLLEIGGVPVQHRARHCLAIFLHAEHAQRGGAMVGEVAVQVAPAAILGRIDAHDGVARVRDLAVAKLHVMAAAQRRRGLAQIDRNRLLPSGAHLPQRGGSEPGRGQRRGAGHADTEWSRNDRVGAAGECHRVRAVGGPAGGRQNRA